MANVTAYTTEMYEGVAFESDAKLVMAMTPEAVSKPWEQFVQEQQPKPTHP